MSEHHYKFNVKMTCSGCSGAVERVLKKLDGTVPSTLLAELLSQCPLFALHLLPPPRPKEMDRTSG